MNWAFPNLGLPLRNPDSKGYGIVVAMLWSPFGMEATNIEAFFVRALNLNPEPQT